jgi:hypothetical protein
MFFFAVPAVFSEGFPPSPSGAALRAPTPGKSEMDPASPESDAAPDDDGFVPLPRGPIPMIVGGGDAEPGAYPWMVSLNKAEAGDLKDGHFCGGSLVHPSWVVTAAHCVYNRRPDQFVVILGVTDLKHPGDHQRLEVAEIICHPDFNPLNFDSDIALLHLKHPAGGGEAVALPLIDDPVLEAPGTESTAIGWGSTDVYGYIHPSRLQQVTLPLVDFGVANGAYDGELTGRMLAAGPGDGTADTCYGDSGGPLVVFDSSIGRALLTGVVSFGEGCAKLGSYGIYSRVSSFRRFILDHISPGYAEWEHSHGVAGRFRDPDGDGRDNAAEFLANSRPSVPDIPRNVAARVTEVSGARYGAIDWTLPVYRPEVDLSVGFSTTVRAPWTPLDLAAMLAGSSTDGSVETLTIRAPETVSTPPGCGFFIAAAGYSGGYRAGLRPFHLPSRTVGMLAAEDPEHPDIPGARCHTYRWTPAAEAGQSVRLFARSKEFDVRLDLLDASGALIESSTDDDGAGILGGDEEITFTPSAGATYLLRISPETSGPLGRYRIGGFVASGFDALPEIHAGLSASVTLGAAAPPDPLRQPGPVFRSRDYRISPVADSWLRVKMNSTAVDASLVVVDAESSKATGWFDDDSGYSRNARLDFRLVAGHHYRVRFTTSKAGQSGNCRISADSIETDSLAPGGSVSGHLSSTDNHDPLDPNSCKDDILVTGLALGASYVADLASDDFDAYLYLLDPVTGEVIDQNDDRSGSSSNSRIVFPARFPSAILRVASYGDGGTRPTGSYVLSFR